MRVMIRDGMDIHIRVSAFDEHMCLTWFRNGGEAASMLAHWIVHDWRLNAEVGFGLYALPCMICMFVYFACVGLVPSRCVYAYICVLFAIMTYTLNVDARISMHRS